MKNILECNNISKSFKNRAGSAQILKDISFAVPQGSFTAITGKSGTGKTTLLNITSGIALPDSGAVNISGQELTALNEKNRAKFRLRNFGMIFQDNNLVDSFTARENILLPFMGLKIRPDMKEIEVLCKELGIDTMLDRYPHALSGGQKQRVTLCRSLAIKPLIIFADEPTGSLDGETEQEVLGLLKTINREKHITIIAVTHSDNLIAIADRVIKIKDINAV